MATKTLLVALALCLSVSSAGFATAEGGGESNLFAGDLGNAIWTLAVFLLAVFVLGKFAWGPLLSILQDREGFIRESLESAKRDRDEAQARLEEYTTKLQEARAEAHAIVDEGRRDAEVVKGKIEQDARDEAGKIIERAKREIGVAKATAIRELYETSATLATEVAAQVLKREVKAADHERLIKDAIEQLGTQDLN
jgi:F-type H+-transporting ATPase subunit b